MMFLDLVMPCYLYRILTCFHIRDIGIDDVIVILFGIIIKRFYAVVVLWLLVNDPSCISIDSTAQPVFDSLSYDTNLEIAA